MGLAFWIGAHTSQGRRYRYLIEMPWWSKHCAKSRLNHLQKLTKWEISVSLYFREISVSPLSLKIASLLQSKHRALSLDQLISVYHVTPSIISNDSINIPKLFIKKNKQTNKQTNPFSLNLLIINNILFWSKKKKKTLKISMFNWNYWVRFLFWRSFSQWARWTETAMTLWWIFTLFQRSFSQWTRWT